MTGKSTEGQRPRREDLDFAVGDEGWRILAAEGPPPPRLVQQKYVPGSTRGFEIVGRGKNARRINKVSGPPDEGNMGAILANLEILTGFTPPPENG